jgi:3-deoxy-D-manno-octulosonate 8-phosphate phosphatase (KDO 8-P phosphatase)
LAVTQTYSDAILNKARQIELVIFDVDGVLTDGRLYYSDNGEELKAFSSQDGAAIKMLIGTGVSVAIITGRQSQLVRRRASELGITHLYQGASDKAVALAVLARETGIDMARMAHVGDDVPDLVLFNRVGMAISVPGAHPEVMARAHYVTQAHAGLGAAREVCHLMMVAQQTWPAALRRFDS